ncbi:MAG: diguanylate cyclase [Deltaproteobacteria bacterium]|nr:diguanylate cyclase [Deltaproteobacteria bacterium]
MGQHIFVGIRFRPVTLVLILLLGILLLGAAGTLALVKHGRLEVQRSYLRAVKSAVAGLAVEDVRRLSGISVDADSPAFKRIRRRLVELHTVNPDSRFVYLMGLQGKTVVFLADAEPPDSPDASVPGDEYPEASEELRAVFVSGTPFIEGPLTDRWGEWVTGFAPVRDEETGTVLAILGLDWDAREWRQRISIYWLFGIALTAFPLLLAATIASAYLRTGRVNRMLTEEMRERRRVQDELERLSKEDALTQLANRRTFDALLDLEWRRALRAQLPLSLLMVDIDGFKSFNDTYGHQQGDEALRRIAIAIRQAVKRAGDETARYGGEEFVAVLPSSDEDGAWSVAEAIRETVEAAGIAFPDSLTGGRLTVSVGVATTVPSVEESPSVLIKRADEALYRAKAAGRNRVERAA